MQLTRHTDYALRLLIALAAAGDARVQIAEVATAHRISLAHLKKVANHLAHLGFIETVRGRGGGLVLARPAEQINLADVICATEPGTTLVQCGGCGLLAGGCRLPGIFGQALGAFREVLSRYSLAELMRQPTSLVELGQAPAASISGTTSEAAASKRSSTSLSRATDSTFSPSRSVT